MRQIVVIGGGAAGFFGAIRFAENNPDAQVIILEQSKHVLGKVRISGGGRCNVTHACFDPGELCKYYPRGHKELRGPFHTFGPKETVQWFESRGVKLKTEADGRMFPVTDSSETIVNCLVNQSRKLNISILKSIKVLDIAFSSDDSSHLVICEHQNFNADCLLIATGSSPSMWKILVKKGYHIIDPVPSLFTFNILDSGLHALAGISVVSAEVFIPSCKIKTSGPILITHWGLSGPAILKASAWGAVPLHSIDYQFELLVDWAPDADEHLFKNIRTEHSRKKVISHPLFGLSGRLWGYLCDRAGVASSTNWADMSKTQERLLIQNIKKCCFKVSGKSTFKEEFVTAGGVDLKQINFKNFGSKLHPGVFFAGEVLNIDALTGGFNFQAAWTGGYLAGGTHPRPFP